MFPQTNHPPVSPQAGFAGVFEFDDFDALRGVAPGWELEHLQVARGRSHVRASIAQTERMLLAVVNRSPGVLERGTPPRGTVVFTISLHGTRLFGQRLPWERDHLAFAPQGVEYEFLSTGPSKLFAVCVSQKCLDEASLERWGERFPVTEAGPCLRFRDGASRDALIRTWSRWLAGARRNSGLVSDPGAVARMEEEVLQGVLGNVVPAGQSPPPRPYRRLALRAESFIRSSLEDQITVEDICSATNASARSVHASFQATFGVPPKAYWKALRLARARDDLRRARRGMTVSEVASKWNFYRFGYFAIDYRQMFHENPSDTLQRALGRSAAPDPTRGVPGIVAR